MIWMLLVLLLLLLALRTPIWLALLGISILYILFEETRGTIVIQRMSSGIESFPLLAVPFFILAGTIMANGGIAERLMNFAMILVGHWRGGLAQINVLNSLMIGGMSGSANADAAVDAKVLVPIMRKNGYSNAFSSAISVASGAISPILPPSIGLILYGVLADVSIGALFIGGVIPAFLIAIALSVTVYIIALRKNFPRARDRRGSMKEIIRGIGASFWALMMPVLLIVGLRMGVFTPTELGAVAVIYALLVAMVVYREISWRDIPRLLREAAITSGIVLVIIAGAAVFGIVVAYERIPDQLSGALDAMSSNPILILLFLNLLLLVLGVVMESTSLMIILVPVLAPIAMDLGIDPVHFGLIIVINLTIGSMTPPVGSVLYTVAAITGVRVSEFARGFFPFFLALVVVLLMVTFIPQLVTWLPSVL